ncbi:MAG: hypothetical protein AB8G22_27245, partial [Saprospiraceae bacterium]
MQQTIKMLLLLMVICYYQNGQAQISTIQPLPPAQKHYADLQQLSAKVAQNNNPLDTLAYPPELYKNSTILFALAKPHYLHSEQVDFLTHALRLPANSSKQTRAESDFLLQLQKDRT